ncbi:MAG: formate dehydrogenase subunit alpha [Candidatus Nanopelagicales bacterium]
MTLLEQPGLLTEPDLGTPPTPGEAAGDTSVELTVDGVSVAVAPGTSVLRAAALAGIDVPKLCSTDRLDAFGSCRMCLVEVEGGKGTPASCTTPAASGMVVRTRSPKLDRLRQGVVELYLSDHPADCAGDGRCELHSMAERVGVTDVRYTRGGENHLHETVDHSNPYFDYDPEKCILCSLCVRACDDIQGTFALTIQGRGFDSRMSAGTAADDFLSSECVSCGACVQACPTDALLERSVVELGMPTRSVLTTCAYCGVGCTFKAELGTDADGEEHLVRMVPYKEGGANEGHSCVKGRFAYGYAAHPDRVLKPRMRDNIADPWREVEWDEVIPFVARRLREIQAQHGLGSIGAIASSRCTDEEVFVMQKLVRAAFGNNNIDTCARVCHAPTGYGLSQTFGTSAGTQDFASVDETDVILVIGANPTDAHPVFASRMKRRLRQGAKLIVVDPRRTDLVRSPHVRADYHLPVRPGTNVAVVNAFSHVVVTEGLVDEDFVARRCEGFADWAAFIAEPEHSPEAVEEITGIPAADLRAAARLYATAPRSIIYYGLGVTEHSQGSTMVMGMANLAMATGNIGRPGVGVNPLRGQNNVQGSCDMGSFPHEYPGYRHVGGDEVRGIYERAWGVPLLEEPGLRIPNMFDAAVDGTYRAMFIQGEDVAQSDPNLNHVRAALGSLDFLVVQDLFENETSKFAHVLLPGTSFLEKDGTFINSERRINRVRPIMEPRCGKQEWEVTCELAQAMGYPMHYDQASQIMDEIAMTTPTFAGVSFDLLDRVGSVQWPCNESAPLGTPVMHMEEFVRGKGRFVETTYVPTLERTTRRFPLILTTGRILSQYNVGAQTRRTDNVSWHERDLLELHPHDAEDRGIRDGDLVTLTSRVGTTTVQAKVAERMPVGVCYTTFHHPETGANVITTELSDWATNCPEYKVTAVQVELTHPHTAGNVAVAEAGHVPAGSGVGVGG